MPHVGHRSRLALASATLLAAGALGVIGYRNLVGWPSLHWIDTELIPFVRDMVAALSFGIAGLVAMRHRPENRTGPLMVLIGIALAARTWIFLPIPALVSLGFWLTGLPVIILGILVLGYPTGHFRSHASRIWVGAAVGFMLIHVVMTLITPLGVWECAECRPLLTLTYDERHATNLFKVEAWMLITLAATLIPILVARWLRASPPARRALAPVWVAGLVFAAVAFTDAVLSSTDIAYDDFADIPGPGRFLRLEMPPVVWTVMPWAVAVSLTLVPIGFLWGLLRSRLNQAAVSALAIELRRTRDRLPLVASLRRALADRTLELGLWSRPAATYVTPDGQPMAPLAGPDRAVTRVDGADGPLAVIVHDPALEEQRDLVDGVTAVAQLALENERLQAEVRAQLEEVRASRERIVSAADAERRRIERNLHDGAQQRLVSLSLALNIAQARAADAAPEVAATLAEGAAELQRAIVELRELARGIHPAILSEAGLEPALESLAEHAPMPVRVRADLDGQRLPAVVEATAYFVVAEALTNVAKHAHASRAELRATVRDGWLHLRVSDDGRGGADPALGTGLRGLFDRVAAVGGRLRVTGGDTGGTILEADIPCG